MQKLTISHLRTQKTKIYFLSKGEKSNCLYFFSDMVESLKYFEFEQIFCKSFATKEYHPSGAGGTHSPPAMPHRLKNLEWPPGGPKMADGVWKWV